MGKVEPFRPRAASSSAGPNQGVQKQIDLFGAAERVGFYNTFAARALQDRIEIPEVGPIEISRDRETGEVHTR